MPCLRANRTLRRSRATARLPRPSPDATRHTRSRIDAVSLTSCVIKRRTEKDYGVSRIKPLRLPQTIPTDKVILPNAPKPPYPLDVLPTVASHVVSPLSLLPRLRAASRSAETASRRAIQQGRRRPRRAGHDKLGEVTQKRDHQGSIARR